MISTSKSVRRTWLAGITLVVGLMASAAIGASKPNATPQGSVPMSQFESAINTANAFRAGGTTHSTSSKANSSRGTSTKATSSNQKSGATETKTITVRSEYTEQEPGFDGARCRGFTDVPATLPDCRAVMAGPATFKGTFQGVSFAESSSHPTADGDHFEGFDTFDDARIEGCGEGGFTFDLYKGRLDVASYDPVTNTMMGYFTWRIRPDSGTGGLSGLISGEGKGHWKMYWSETGTQTWGRGLITGTVTCEVTRAGGGTADKDSGASGSGDKVTIVRGEYVNDNALICTEVRPTSDPIAVQVTCSGPGAYWNGGFTGHTIVKLDATMDNAGNIKGTYDDYFYGAYTGDNTFGELHFKGTFRTEGIQFFAEGKIVDGTCGFAGSTGTFTANGNGVFGGYKAEWIRPKTPVAPDPTCNPLDPNSLP